MEQIKEVIGILLLECANPECKRLFVVNTETVRIGFTCTCECGRRFCCPPFSTIEFSFRQFNLSTFDPDRASTKDWAKYCREVQRDYEKKASAPGRETLPIDEYKTLLVDMMMGKKPKIPAKSKKAVSLEDSGVDVVSIVNTLRGLGFSEKDAMSKINVAIKDGFKFEEEIITYIMTLS